MVIGSEALFEGTAKLTGLNLDEVGCIVRYGTAVALVEARPFINQIDIP